MKHLGFLFFAVAAYAVSMLTLTYLIAFLVDLPMVPRAIDHPASGLSAPSAILIDLALLAVFGLQHSLMARRSFKAAWTRIVPAVIERSGYMVFSSLALILLFVFWQPLPDLLWDLRGTGAEYPLWAVFALGWMVVLLSTFLINHFELFGLAQVWSHWRGAPAVEPKFHQPLFYKLVRHPLYTGFTMVFWATPAMSQGHLLFAVGMLVYTLIAIEFEERDLVALFGADYEAYQKKVGKLAPRLR